MTAEAIITSDQRRSLAAAIICTSAVGTTMGLMWPLLSLILDGQGVDGRLIGLSSATQSLAGLVMSPFVPWLISLFGMRRTAGGCILVILAALAFLHLFENVYPWFAIRLVLGAAVTTLFLCTQTWVNRLAPDHARGRIIGIYGFLWSAGFGMGPLIIRIAGAGGWPPFLIAILLVALAGIPLLLAAEPEVLVYRPGLPRLPPLLSLAGVALAASLFQGTMDATGDSFFPLFGLRNGLAQGDAVTMLIVLQIGVLAIQLPIGWAADRMNRSRLLLVMTVLAFVICLLLPHMVHLPLGLWPSLFLLGVATGGVWTVSLALMGEVFRGEQLASALALRSILYGLGAVVGPPIGGLALGAWSGSGLPMMLAAVCAAFALLQIALLRAGRPGERRVEGT